tara:strand:- start:16 stop:327 length:312 start_codon:yes stop_codon:yes gene_type:complete
VDLVHKVLKDYKARVELDRKVFKDHLVSKAYRVIKVVQELVSKEQAVFKVILVSKVFKVSKELPVMLLLKVFRVHSVLKDFKDKTVQVLQESRVIQVGKEYKV